jgi:para-aminobenzoate synthetase/4-amino-4-deoxychorismate lyase
MCNPLRAVQRLLLDGRPFVLFDDARSTRGAARLFSAPVETFVAHSMREVAPALEGIRGGPRRGLHAAGWLGYEAGLALEPRLMRTCRSAARIQDAPLLWFALFEQIVDLSGEELTAALPDPEAAWLSPPRPRITRSQYADAFRRIKEYIEAGDVYQVNLSYRSDLTLVGHPLSAYAQMRRGGGGEWSALVHDGERYLLSTSPELFFRLSDSVIETKPMKGTTKRRENPTEDALAMESLRCDPKERAENVMIVDLLRNDISRIAKRGSVHVPALFEVETYPTLHALTSTVRAEVSEDCDAVDVLRTLFPCGSVTGAPKIRAMEIIDELEADERGAYCGAIGWISPDGAAAFNVAIRTMAILDGAAELGLGSGVVFDSTLDGEWRECALKGAFVTAAAPVFRIFETMRYEPEEGLRHLDLHLARMRLSACTFAFEFNELAVRDRLANAVEGAGAPLVVRLLLDATGEISIEMRPPPSPSRNELSVAIAALPVSSDDFRLRHKTTLRSFLDMARHASGADEVVFVDAAGFITEGSFTNVFIERDGQLLTPPASRGLLPGVLRASLLRAGRAREAELRVEDLGGPFHLGNAVRGLLPAQLTDHARQHPASAGRLSSV